MWKQSVWTSTISSHLATKHLKDGGLLTLAGAKAALTGTPGNSISGHTAAYPHCNLGLPILHTILQPSRTGQVTCPCQRVDLQGNLARPKLAELFSQVSQAIPIAITELEPPPPLSLSPFSLHRDGGIWHGQGCCPSVVPESGRVEQWPPLRRCCRCYSTVSS